MKQIKTVKLMVSMYQKQDLKTLKKSFQNHDVITSALNFAAFALASFSDMCFHSSKIQIIRMIINKELLRN